LLFDISFFAPKHRDLSRIGGVAETDSFVAREIRMLLTVSNAQTNPNWHETVWSMPPVFAAHGRLDFPPT
jgi:hypothetical protein